MMRYDFFCEEHGPFEKILSMDEEHEALCPVCKTKARRLFNSLPFSVDFTAGYDPGLGEYVDTKRQRENIISKSDLRRIKC